jgi:hypothetical protein
MPLPDFSTFRMNVLAFLDRCYPSAGVVDADAWEAAGAVTITSPEAQARYVRPENERVVVTKTLDARLREDDWAFASTPGGGESLEGGHSAVEALWWLGELDRLSPANRAAWVAYFNAYQDPDTGYFLGPYIPAREHPSWQVGAVCTHPWDHMHDHLVACLGPVLHLLGGHSRLPLSHGSMTGRFLQEDYLNAFLRGRDWNDYRHDLNFRRHNPWWMGNEFWYPGMILWLIAVWEAGTAEGREARRLLDEVWYRWHDANWSEVGFWSGDLDGDPALQWGAEWQMAAAERTLTTRDGRRWAAMQVMGGAHQLWNYGFDGHPIPAAVRRRQTDTVLALFNPHTGHFGLGDVENPGEWSNNCMDVDCTTLLAINYHAQDYRRAEIAAALERAARAILTDRVNAAGVLESNLSAPFTHNFNSLPTFSPAGWGNVLNQSFYVWALAAACSVVSKTTDPRLQSFLDHPWPQMPSPWLWVPR